MAPSMNKTYTLIFAAIIAVLYILFMATGTLGINIVIGSIIMGIGLVSVIMMFSVKGGSGKDNNEAISKKLLFAFVMIVIGGFLLFSEIAPEIIKRKLLGLVITATGYFLAFKYQFVSDYQRDDFAITGAIVGIIMFLIGLYLLLF
ncbi:MAG: hypothetical protein KAJ47_02480 [Candidatus Aenigmarchaeota archaeon]|nr:hypothetical protein [Candidatus Aenigmarchaeota archaeon]